MKALFLCLVLWGVVGCELHKQENFNSEQEAKLRDTEEKRIDKLAFQAISKGDLNSLKSYIDSGLLQVDQMDESGRTLLIAAVIGNKYAIVEYLISKEASLEVQDGEGKTAKDYAGSDKVMVKLLNREDLPEAQLNDLMMSIAIPERRVELLEFLLSQGADPNVVQSRKSPLIAVVYQKVSPDLEGELLKLVQVLLGHPKIDVNLKVGRYTALVVADKNGYGEIASYLRSHGAR
ncbi:MAG: hypothetical protein CL676_01335 [Bdellovibrionaceae bacterium]|nr:hypothetical protein [Pseudobdellovibrionaceae bacterium]|tara:strand:+ start:582 stop:1283 length:702 start_codon:yes stop_codon:yes gene_type:complete